MRIKANQTRRSNSGAVCISYYSSYALSVINIKTTLFFSSALLLRGFTAQASLSDTSEASSEPPKTVAYVEARLESIQVADFKIERASFSKALQYLDSVLEPHGLQILFRPYEKKDPEVTLKTRNLTFSNNLSYLCRQAGYDWWVEEGVIIVAQPESNEALVTDVIPISNPTARRFTYREYYSD